MVQKSIGLVIITKEPNGYSAVLQIRKRGKFVTTFVNGNFSGRLQIFSYKKLENDFSLISALIRGASKELGIELVEYLSENFELPEVMEVRNNFKHIITYTSFIPRQYLTMIQLGDNIANLRYVSEEEFSRIIPITKDMKKDDISDGQMVMFPDEIEAVKKAFEIIKKLTVK